MSDNKKPEQTVDPVVEAIQDGFAALKTHLDRALSTIAHREPPTTAPPEPERRDATGKPFRWGSAPMLMRRRPDALWVSNLLRAAVAGGTPHAISQYAAGEWEMHERLVKLGYHTQTLSGVLFPLGSTLLMADDPTADLGRLRTEIQERMALQLDPGELAWTLKRLPEAARMLGVTQKDLQMGDDTLGGYLVPITQADEIIDLLRPRVAVARAGAREIPLPPTGNLTYPRLTADPSFAWGDPDTTVDATSSNAQFGVVRLQARPLRGWVTIPNDLIRYSTPSVEAIIRNALAMRAAVAEDLAWLEGRGNALEPTGIIRHPTSTAEQPATGKLTLHLATTTGANGDTFEPEDPMKMLGLYYTGNDPDPATGWIMRPMMWAAIANRRADAVTANDRRGPFMFWTTRGGMGDLVPERLVNIPVYVTTSVSNTRTKGTGSNLTYVLLGNFQRVLIGRVGTIELAVSEHVRFFQDKTVVRGVLRADMGLEHEESFVLCDQLVEA